jgi:hypothetical protein
LVTGLSKPLDHNEPFEFESDNETAEVEIDLQLSMQEQLARAIEMEMKFQITSIVKKGKRGANLESCYEHLKSIPPSSVKSVTKIRSSLHVESVDMLIFLGGYFKTENN